MPQNYQHKHDADRVVVAEKVTEKNVDILEAWHNNEVRPSVGEYVVLDSEGVFHTRPASVFEAKYELSENQDQELVWPDDHMNNDGYVESDEKGYIPFTEDEVSGENEDADPDRLQ